MPTGFVHTLFPELSDRQSVQDPVFSRKRITAFLVTLFQLLAVLLIIKNFNIEKSSGISQISSIIIISFIINSFVPLRYRQLVLFSTCIAVIFYAFGAFAGSLLMMAALGIVGICHLPIKFWYRVFIIVLIFAGLFILRIQLFYFLRATLISPFIASMFMFRIIIYLYEVKHGLVPVSVWQSLCYFFLFPNICFLFFPIIDYKTYSKTYYNIPDTEIWQKGIRWMLRGLTHIIAYRIVYYYLLIGPGQVTGLPTLLQYMISSYVLVLRLSGLFHFIIGLLCLFGLNLPQPFDNYFLATNFTNLWRRINVYWREFMLKIFFYPIMFKLKKKITKNLLATTMLCVFVISWAFHGYQWFWVRGNYTFNIIDLVFWLVIGGCITANAVIQEKQSQKIAKVRSANAMYLFTILKIMGMFLFMSVMWSLWQSSSFGEWFYLLSKFRNASPADVITLVVVLVGVILFGFTAQVVLNMPAVKKLMAIKPQDTLFLTLPSLLLLLCCSFNSVKETAPPVAGNFIKTLSEEKLNDHDYQKAEENYYKKLIDGEENTVTGLWEINLKRPRKFNAMDDIYIRTNDLLTKIYKPNYKVYVGNDIFTTDSFGLRDKNYAFVKPAKTYRMALLGGSYEMGSGVGDADVYEVKVEEKLNAMATDTAIERFEIFNFAAGGFYSIQHVELCHTKVFQYKPDAVLYIAHSGERWRLVNTLANLIGQGKNLKYPLLNFIKNTAHIKQSMSKAEVITRLNPYTDILITWAYSEIANECHKNNALPVWVYLPTTTDTIDKAEFNYIKQVAARCGYVQLDLTGAYGNLSRNELIISQYNTHPTPKGHTLIADKFYQELIKNRKLIFDKNR